MILGAYYHLAYQNCYLASLPFIFMGGTNQYDLKLTPQVSFVHFKHLIDL